MKIIILGANGMLGHKLCQILSMKKHSLLATKRNKQKLLLKNINLINNFDVQNLQKVRKLFLDKKPDIVINCTGLIKQKDKFQKMKKNFFFINGKFPALLDKLSKELNFFHIHFSSDCVFNGKGKLYTEKSKVNATDDYGKSKIYAEKKIKNNTLILRTSIIGHEINKHKYGLLEWFLNSEKDVEGYRNFYFSGLTTIELSKIVNIIITKKLFYSGIYNISSNRISKFELLKKINKIYKLNKNIIKNISVKLDRSLNSNLFKKKFKIKIENWDNQIRAMHKDHIINKNENT